MNLELEDNFVKHFQKQYKMWKQTKRNLFIFLNELPKQCIFHKAHNERRAVRMVNDHVVIFMNFKPAVLA